MAYGGFIDRNEVSGSAMDEENDSITVTTEVENISLEDRFIQSDIFKKPACLIYTDDKGLLAIDFKVLSQLSRIECKLNIVGICGLYRTGKSYLMNWLAGEQTGFALGNTIESETKGIWVWCIDHPHKNDQALLLVDTEGLDDPEKGDPDHDNKLFCLTMLLSSVLIVNIKGVFDYAALDKLAFITTLSSEIKIMSHNDDEESNARSIPVASPRLLMCIRDFQLKAEKKGRTLTPDKYLEECLEPSTKAGRNTEKFNMIKESITKFFPKRKCFLLSQPAMGEDLKNIENLDAENLTEDFVTDVTELKKYIYDRKPKRICNASKQTIDGADLASLITTYVEALRNETPIQCDSAYSQAAKQRNERVLCKTMKLFQAEMDKCTEFTSKVEVQDVFLHQYEMALSKYRDGAFVYRQDFYEDKATEEMKTYVDKIKSRITNKCIDTGTKWLTEKYQQLLEENVNEYMTVRGYEQYETDMSNLETTFTDHMKKFDPDDVLRCLFSFKDSISDDKMELYRAATGNLHRKSYCKAHETIQRALNTQMEKVINEERAKRKKIIEAEIERLQKYVVLKEKAKSKRFCSIM